MFLHNVDPVMSERSSYMPIAEKRRDETKGQITDETLGRILAFYGFGDSWSLLPVVPVGGTLVVLNAKAETTRKAVVSYQRHQYLLKEVPWYCSEASFVQFMLTFYQQLADEQFPVPELIAARGMHRSFVEVDNHFYYLQRFLLGASYSEKQTEIWQAGANLARMHRLSAQFSRKFAEVEAHPFRESTFRLSREMVGVLENLINVNRGRMGEMQSQRLSEYCREATTLLTKLEKDVQPTYSLSTIQVHGDYNPLNLLYGPEGTVIATLDFENTALDNPVHDIAEGLLNFCFHLYRPSSARFARLPHDFRKEAVLQFIDGYRRFNPAAYEATENILPQVLTAVFIELYTLGLVRGDYDFATSQGIWDVVDLLHL